MLLGLCCGRRRRLLGDLVDPLDAGRSQLAVQVVTRLVLLQRHRRLMHNLAALLLQAGHIIAETGKENDQCDPAGHRERGDHDQMLNNFDGDDAEDDYCSDDQQQMTVSVQERREARVRCRGRRGSKHHLHDKGLRSRR